MSGDFGGVAKDVQGEIASVVCRTVEEEIKAT